MTGSSSTFWRVSKNAGGLSSGGLLPTFMQQPPPVFAAVPTGWPVRVLAFGDFGDGSDAQKEVATTMLAHHRQKRFDFAVTLGDNFNSTGMESPRPTAPRSRPWLLVRNAPVVGTTPSVRSDRFDGRRGRAMESPLVEEAEPR